MLQDRDGKNAIVIHSLRDLPHIRIDMTHARTVRDYPPKLLKWFHRIVSAGLRQIGNVIEITCADFQQACRRRLLATRRCIQDSSVTQFLIVLALPRDWIDSVPRSSPVAAAATRDGIADTLTAAFPSRRGRSIGSFYSIHVHTNCRSDTSGGETQHFVPNIAGYRHTVAVELATSIGK